jgi:hypothetical protein
MQDMPVDLSSFLNSMFKTQEVVMTKPVTREPSVLFTQDDDGVWTLSFNGKTLGWVNRVNNDVTYRSLSAITNNMAYFYSLDNARNYLYEQSH